MFFFFPVLPLLKIINVTIGINLFLSFFLSVLISVVGFRVPFLKELWVDSAAKWLDNDDDDNDDNDADADDDHHH